MEKSEIAALIENAEKLHGHLGPFLVIGVKMSLFAMKNLKVKNGDNLVVKAKLRAKTPYTCILDGIQATTSCTFGNRKLSLEETDSSEIIVKFVLKNNGKQATIQLRQEIVEYLNREMRPLKISDLELRKLAWRVAETPEEKLFTFETQ